MPTTDEIRQFEARLAREPTSQAYAALAEAYRRAGRAGEAVTLCREGLARHPGYVTTRLVLAKALLEVGDVQGARAEIQRFLGGEPDHEPGLRIAVECAPGAAIRRGPWGTYRLQATLDPQTGPCRARPGRSRWSHGRVTPTWALLWPLLVDDMYATVAFGDLCLAQGLTDEATAVFSRIVVRQPDHETARARLGDLGRPRGAVRRPRG